MQRTVKRIKTVIDNSIICFWSWNDNIESDEIIRQLEDFSRRNIGGVVVHARAGLKIPYMREKWLDLFETAVITAEKLGLSVYIYDEDGWPSGYAGGMVTSANDDFQLKRIKFGEEMPDSPKARLLASYKKIGTEYRITDTESEAALFCYYEAEPHYADLLNPDAVDRFIEVTHEVYRKRFSKYFGKTIPGFFTDEPQLSSSGFVWSYSVAEAYLKKYGTSVFERLWMLYGNSKECLKFQNDYYNISGELFRNNYTRKIYDWCEKNDLALTGHFPAEDGLCGQPSSSGGVMPHYKFMQLPGIDHLGNRLTSPVLSKQASSVSRQFGNGNVLSETFGCSGWGVTFRQLARIWGWQSVLGITKPCLHLAAYSLSGLRKRDYPAVFSYQEPWWDDFGFFAGWLNRLNSLLTEGERVCDTLVLLPDNLMQNGMTAAENLSCQFRLLLENLIDAQIDFDLADSRMIDGFSVSGGKFIVGKIEYETVILSQTQVLSESLNQLLHTFAESGGRIVVINSIPEITDSGNRPFDFSTTVLQNRRDLFIKYTRSLQFERQAEVLNCEDLKIADGIAVHIRRIGEKLRIHLFNRSYDDKKIYIKLPFVGGLIKKDLCSGKDERLRCDVTANETFCRICLCGGESFVADSSDVKAVPRLLKTEEKVLAPVSVIPTEMNSLAVDYAAVSVDGEDYGKPMPVKKITEFLFDTAFKKNKTVKARVKYTFNVKNSVPKQLFIAAETDCCDEITVNSSTLLKNDRSRWYIDKSIKLYDVSDIAVPGENTVIMSFTVPNIEGAYINGSFETERNRFFYPVEVESVIINGDFDTEFSGTSENRINHYRLRGSFSVAQKTEKHGGDITPQGFWFYRGNVDYTFVLPKPDENIRIYVKALPKNCVLQRLAVGENEIRTFEKDFQWDVTDFLTEDENVLTITAVGSNRNLFGPHHHINGENCFVGPSTFEGVRGFEDFVSPGIGENTWTDEYSFVPFGIDGLTVIKYREAI